MYAYELLKLARWTKHLPDASRTKAEAILAGRSYEKLQEAMSRGRPSPPLASMLQRENRLQGLLNAANMDDMTKLPRITGGDSRVNPKTKLTRVEEALYGRDKDLARRVRRKIYMPTSGKLPKDLPKYGPVREKMRTFFSGLGESASKLKDFAKRNNKRLMAGGAVTGALGLGLLGLHAATKDRHEKVHGGNA
jgi:hypothetical protein